MRKTDTVPRPKRPKDIAADIAERGPLDHTKVKQASRRAVQAADRLLKEMDDVLKNLERERKR